MITRILSGIVLLIFAISSMLIGGPYLYFLVALISLTGIYELYRVVNVEKSVLAAVGYVSAIAYLAGVYFTDGRYDVLLVVAAMMGAMCVYVLCFPKYKIQDATMVVFGIIYVVIALSYIYKVREFTDGIYLVWLIFIASWGNDTCAYFIGVLFGKHKMSPVLSPKKSIEGAVGGVSGAAILGAIYGYIVSGQMSNIVVNPIIIFAVASGIGAFLAIIGDLCASAIKRNYDIKDYGKLIPGHGGILDRFDSVIFTAPVVYWAVFLINKM